MSLTWGPLQYMLQQNCFNYRASVAVNILFLVFILATSSAIAKEDKTENESHITDQVVQKVMQLEGLGQASFSAGNLAQALFDSLGSKTTAPTAAKLFAGADKSTDKKIRDVQFVFGLMALSLNGKNNEAIRHLQKYQPHLTYMDELPGSVDVGRPGHIAFINETQPQVNEILSFAYAWLINNTEVTVPCWFIKQQTEIFDHATPFWGATRDAYFSVCTPTGWNLSTLPGFKELQKGLHDAYNPGGGFLGSIANIRHKNMEFSKGLLANNPKYYLQNSILTNRLKWLSYWKYLGPYNNGVVLRINKAAEELQSALTIRLINGALLNPMESEDASAKYINNLISDAVGWSYESYEEYIRELDVNGWEDWEEPLDRMYASEIVGGYLLYEKTTAKFIEYIKWLWSFESEENRKTIFSLMNTAAASNTLALREMLKLNLLYPVTWGAFNKSPLLYAVQYNNLESYQLLKSIPSMDTLTLYDENSWDCDMPGIGKRNVLTYAAENADAQLLSQVIIDFGKKYGKMQDTNGRSIHLYLYNNKKLSEDEQEGAIALFNDSMLAAQYFIDQGKREEATFYLTLAAEENNPDALYELGVYAQESKQYEKSVKCFQQALKLDPQNNAARFELARMYMHGWGTAKKEQTAFTMMKHVANEEVDNPTLRAFAASNIGLYFLQGQGVAQSNTQATKHLEKAVDGGNETIIARLELMVSAGEDHTGVIDNVLHDE